MEREESHWEEEAELGMMGSRRWWTRGYCWSQAGTAQGCGPERHTERVF